jgi:hypothetical protein
MENNLECKPTDYEWFVRILRNGISVYVMAVTFGVCLSTYYRHRKNEFP